MATEEDWDSYRAAVVDVTPPGGAPFRIIPAEPGTVGAWPEGLTPPVFVITAWNPDSVRLTPEENQARHVQLLGELELLGLPWWPAVGRDPASSHAEEGILISQIAEAEALAIGRAYGQAAVFAWTPVAWEIISCSDDRRHVGGWRALADLAPTA